MTDSVFRLGDGGEIEKQMFNFVLTFNRRTELEFSTSAQIADVSDSTILYSFLFYHFHNSREEK